MTGTIELDEITAKSGEKSKGYWKIAETPSMSVQLPIFLISGKGNGPTLSLIAGTKPCVYAGIVACIRISQLIEPAQLNGNLISCPVIDIPSFNSRTPDVCSIDLKPIPREPEESGSMSNIIGKARREIMNRGEYAIDLHGGDIDENLLEGIVISGWTGDSDYDEKVIQMVKWFRPTAWQRRPTRDVKSVPNIIVESGGGGKLLERQIRFHIDGVLNIMRGLGMLEGPVAPAIQPDFVYGIGQRHVLRAHRGGMYYSRVNAGDLLESNQIIGSINNMFGEVLEEIRSPVRGRIIAYWDENKVVNSGDIIGVVYEQDKETDFSAEPPSGWIR